MSTLPNPVNQAVSVIDVLLHGAVESVGMSLAKAALISDFPWLAWPILNTLLDFGLGRLGKYIYKAADTAAVFAAIDAQSDEKKSGYKDAVIKLKALSTTEGMSNAEREKVIADYKASLSKLIHYGH